MRCHESARAIWSLTCLVLLAVPRHAATDDLEHCPSVGACRHALATARRARIAAQQRVADAFDNAEDDAARVGEIKAMIAKYPEEIRYIKNSTTLLHRQAAYLREELARLNDGLSDEKSSYDKLRRDVDDAKAEAAVATRNATAAEGRAAREAEAVERARAAEAKAEDELHFHMQPPWYRPVYRWVDWMHYPSRQRWIASLFLVLGVGGLLLPGRQAAYASWTLCLFGIPFSTAVYTWAYLGEVLAHSHHWGILLTFVPLIIFFVLALSLFRGYHGLFFLLGAWIGKSLGCILPTFYESAFEVAFVRLVFLALGLSVTSTSLPNSDGPRNLEDGSNCFLDPVLQIRRDHVWSDAIHLYFLRAHVCRLPCIFSLFSLCGLLFSSSVVFFVTRVPWVHAGHDLCWLDFASGLLGDRRTQDELSNLWFGGAFVWMVAVGLRVAYYVQMEMAREESECETHVTSNTALLPDEMSNAQKESSRLVPAVGSEDNADLHEVVALIARTSATLRELDSKLPNV